MITGHGHAGTGGTAIGAVENLTLNSAGEPESAAVVEALRPGRNIGVFVGRDAEVKQLLDLLGPGHAQQDGRATQSGAPVVVSAVLGMGGIGKTALAERTALLAAERGWFAGGVLRVDLRGYTPDRPPVRPEQTYGWLLRELGLSAEQVPSTIDAQAGAYHQVLDQLAVAGRRVLLVLDNAADVAQVEDLLPRHLAHRALITTRDVLALPRARRISLDVLPESDAVELLIRLLHDASPQDLRPGGELAAVVRLVRLCGLLPLAVEIVAAILLDEPTLSVAELVAQLSDAETRLPGITHGIGEVAAVINFSYQRLTTRNPDAAALLSLATLNPGPDFHTDAAAALADVETAVAAQRLRALRAASLLQYTAAGRWRLHDLIALYARSLLAPEAVSSATSRLLDHYSVTADEADDHLRALPGQPVPARFTGRQGAMTWFDAEHTNLVAAVGHAHQTSHFTHTVRLASCLAGYLSRRRYLQDWVTVATYATTAAASAALDHSPATAIAWNNLGLALRETRRFDEAISAHQNELKICQELGDRHGEATAWTNLGTALEEVRRFDEAIAAQRQAGDGFRELGDRHGEAMACNNLGLALQNARRVDEAIVAQQRARELYQELGDRHGEAMVRTNLGSALEEVGRFDEAIAAQRQAGDGFRALGDRHGEALAWTNLGLALQGVRRFDEAVAAYQQARDLYQEAGDRRREAVAWGNLGNALEGNGRHGEALRAWGTAVAAFEDAGDGEQATQLRNWLASFEHDEAG